MRRPLSVLAGTVAVAALAAGAWWLGRSSSDPGAASPAAPSDAPAAAAEAGEGHPNVLIVVWDTTRADHLSAYGYGRPTTPWLEAFAREGVLYERAVSPAMWTLPSHASLFTGLPESAHGASSHHKWLDDRFTTMAEAFGAAGYDTWLFSANPYLGDHTNLGQGFDQREFPWDDRWKAKARRATLGKLDPADASNSLGPAWKETRFPAGRSNDKVKDAAPIATEALQAWLDGRARPERPWLAVINDMEAHAPRIPSRASRVALFGEDAVAEELAFDQSYGFLLAYMVDRHEFTPRELQLVTDVYDATLRDLDAATAGLMDALEERGVLDDTIVVITADHGEHLGEHHLMGHKFSVYNPLIRVPLVIRYPKGLPPGRVAQVVSNLDVLATVAELADVPAPPGTLSRSLLHLEGREPVAFAELTHATPQALERMSDAFPDLDWKPFLTPRASVETADAKCIVTGEGTRQVFAMPDDALETTDLAAADPARTEALCGRIDAWRASFPAFDAASAAPPPKKRMDAKTRERLAALGYLDEVADSDAAKK